ncbi:hypothetical protein DRO02_03220 [archaeon]|nr:MAG: hypothetical protein DRO02_03220 [archaeon]
MMEMRMAIIDPIIAFLLMLIFSAGLVKFSDAKLNSMKQSYSLISKKLMAHEILHTLISDERFLGIVLELRAGNMAQVNRLMNEILGSFKCEVLVILQIENITYIYGDPEAFTEDSAYGFSRIHIAGLNMILECYVA